MTFSKTNEHQTELNMNKKFAIFITSYNYAEFIGQAIESVINQTDPNWHLYIIDDCSTDNTDEVVKQYLEKDKRISWKKHDKNIGSIATIIEGFSEIDADYISTLCSDDLLTPDFVADAKKAFEKHPEIPFCAFAWKVFMNYADKNKTFSHHAKMPLTEKIFNKIYLSPYTIPKNFFNINFLVFNSQKIKSVLQNFLKPNSDLSSDNLEIQKYLETFLITELETEFGAGYFNSDCHGYWRRHTKQLTTLNLNKEKRYSEKYTLSFAYCKKYQKESNNLIAVANSFLYLSACLCKQHQLPYKAAAEFIIDGHGANFGENYTYLNLEFIRKNGLKKQFLCVALCVWSAFIFNYGTGVWDKNLTEAKQLINECIQYLRNEYNLQNMLDIAHEANKLYDGLFMPLIKSKNE